MKRKLNFLAALAANLLLSLSASAQISKAKAALTTATSDLAGLFDTATKITYAVAAIVGLIGAIVVYQKWSSGDPNVNKLIGAWFGAALFLAVVATFLRAMFL